MSVWGRQRRWRGERRPSGLRRLGDAAVALAILVLLALSVAKLDQVATRQVAGSMTVNDGDSLTFGQDRIRLRGIDAPELDQKCTANGRQYGCGVRARRALIELASARVVKCEGWERDRYRRLLARCEAGGRDLGRAMVEAGWAVSYGDYGQFEAEARDARKGLWAGAFDQPSDWRAGRRGLHESPHDWMGQIMNFLRQLFMGGD